MKKLNYIFILYGSAVVMSSCSSDDSPKLDFKDQVFTISEDVTPGSLVGDLHDKGFDLSFELLSGNADDTFLLTTDGKLTVKTTDHIDFGETEKYDLTVQATREKENIQTKVTVNVTDVDETNLMLLNGTKYDFNHPGLIRKVGPVYPLNTNDSEGAKFTHYGYSFAFSDGQLTNPEEDINYDFEDISILFYAPLYSPGTDSFSEGTFEYFSEESTSQEPEGRHVFTQVVFGIDNNGDGLIQDFASDIIYLITSGSIVVNKLPEEDHWKLEFDVLASKIVFDPDDFETYHLVTGSKRHLRFVYQGVFEVRNGDDDPVVEVPIEE